ncbi:hypothetical protein ACFV0O_36565 [Kitasatospora sp. NPDC059577]|uniref:hypothetical protein n=1 Tax=Kitasatospora sp. NPDC059577 TaxID=3346873 RepID=UPI0036BE96C2
MRDPGAPGGSRPDTGAGVRVLARGVLVLAGLAVTALGFAWFVDTYDRTIAYRHAPVCATAAAAPGTDCVRHETGRVTAARALDEDARELRIARESAPTDRYEVGKAFYEAVEIGTDVDLTVFRGRVAEVSYRGHRAANPIRPWQTSVKVALLVAAGSALTVRGASGPRRNARRVILAGAGWVAFLSALGGFAVLSSQGPFVVSLGVPLLGWLGATAITTLIAVTDD